MSTQHVDLSGRDLRDLNHGKYNSCLNTRHTSEPRANIRYSFDTFTQQATVNQNIKLHQDLFNIQTLSID